MIDICEYKKVWSSLLVLDNRKQTTLLYDRVKIRLVGH